MKPTLDQLYDYSEFFIKKYEEAGVPNARARMRGLLPHIMNYRNLKYYAKTMVRDRNRRLRALTPTDVNCSKNRSKFSILSQKKSLASVNITTLVYSTHTKRREEDLLRRLDKWPEIEFTIRDMKASKDMNPKPLLKPDKRRSRSSQKYQ